MQDILARSWIAYAQSEFRRGDTMRIGVPKEIKNHEGRVGLTPDAVRTLVGDGHTLYVERMAGARIGFSDADFSKAGAKIAEDPESLYGSADLIVKVKEPQPSEFGFLRPDLTVFGYLHLAAERPLAEALMSSGCTAVAYETVVDEQGRLPMLAPMSAIAGCLSIQMGAWALQSTNGGKGQLLSPVPGAPAARVTVLGGGNAGEHALRVALGLSAQVCVVDLNESRLASLKQAYGPQLATSTPEDVHELVANSDLVVGAVLLPGAAAPRLVTREMVESMSRGSVLVDISIDQGGCFETSRATTHDAPTFVEHEVVHYCVTNMPAAVSRTSTQALVNATLPAVRELAGLGAENLWKSDRPLQRGINVMHGEIAHPAVCDALTCTHDIRNGTSISST